MVVERVGHPVAKVVNPLGTVITVSADDEEAISFSQQDYDEDASFTSLSTPTTCSTSSNICAEEGKLGAPGDDKEEIRELREHTEICAEMRTANEPAAIDSVPPDSIEELKERRTLCAEAATTNTSCARIDLDRVGAFKDVPSSPSLCAERGAVPDCSNVIQAPGRIRCVVGILEEEGVKTSSSTTTLDKELGFQMIDERPTIVAPPPPESVVVVAKVNTSSSDDDIVHVNKEELALVSQPPKKQSASSDDDIEHVLHSDIPVESEAPKPSSRISSRKRSKDKQRVAAAIAPIIETIPDVPKEIEKPAPKEPEVVQLQQQQSYSKKTRIRSKRQPATTSPPNDMIEIINMDMPTEPEMLSLPDQPPPTPPASPPPTPPQTPPPPPPPVQPPVEKFDDPADMVEIIDIDAEKSSGCFPEAPPPDCQILLPKPEPAPKKRNKRQKQQQQPPPPPRQRTPELGTKTESSPEKELIPQELSIPPPPNVWMSKLRSRSSSLNKPEDTETAAVPAKPLLEIEADEEANKENVDISKQNEEENLTPKSEIIEEAMEDIVSFEKPMICEEPMEDLVTPDKPLICEEVEKKPEKEVVSYVPVERSSSSDEVVVPMDVKEEESSDSNGREQREMSTLSDKSTCAVVAGDVNVNVLPTSTSLPAKKNNRSKKKKRR